MPEPFIARDSLKRDLFALTAFEMIDAYEVTEPVFNVCAAM